MNLRKPYRNHKTNKQTNNRKDDVILITFIISKPSNRNRLSIDRYSAFSFFLMTSTHTQKKNHQPSESWQTKRFVCHQTPRSHRWTTGNTEPTSENPKNTPSTFGCENTRVASDERAKTTDAAEMYVVDRRRVWWKKTGLDDAQTRFVRSSPRRG